MNGRQIENKTLKVAVAKPAGSEKLCNLYIANLEPHVTKDDLQTIFQPYGAITEVKILTDKATNSSRGVGFVKYEQPSQADAALKALDGVTLAGTSKPLTVRVADKKDDKATVPAASAYGRPVRYNPMGYFPPGYQMQGYQTGYPGYQVSLSHCLTPSFLSFQLFFFHFYSFFLFFSSPF